MILQTERLILRPWEETDAQALYINWQLMNDTRTEHITRLTKEEWEK